MPGIGTFLGGAVGSLFGGAVGSLFGGKKPKRPATKEKLALNLGGYADGDMSYTLPGDWSGDATAQKVTDYYAVLAHSWNGMGQEAEDQFVSTIAGAAQSAVEQAQSLQKLLPESYSEAFQKELQARPIELFYRYRDKDIDDDTLTEIAAEIQEETNRVMLSAFQALDFSEYAGKIDVDQSSLEGMTLFGNAVAVVDETLSAIKELQEPTSEWETAAKSAVAQMKAWEETMKSTGVTAEYAVQLMEDYRGAYIDNFITTLDESLHPLSAYAQAVNDANDAVDQRKQALEIMGATEEQLARVESMRAEVVDFDMLYGHRRDVAGYAAAATEFDRFVADFIPGMREGDLLMITADHGCDPSYTKTTDHTREYVPYLICGKGVKPGVDLGTRLCFGTIAQTICEYLDVDASSLDGKSVWNEIKA